MRIARVGMSSGNLSVMVHAQMHDIDGILFNPRLTAGGCVAIYDRAFAALSATPPIALLRSTLLPAELVRLAITVRRKRGFGNQ
jgi:hypothetical protein